MPKNKGKGGKNRRRGKNENEGLKRELVFKEDGQEYAQVTKMLGNSCKECVKMWQLPEKHTHAEICSAYWVEFVFLHECALSYLCELQPEPGSGEMRLRLEECKNMGTEKTEVGEEEGEEKGEGEKKEEGEEEEDVKRRGELDHMGLGLQECGGCIDQGCNRGGERSSEDGREKRF